MKKYIYTCFLFALTTVIHAQEPLPCGNYKIDTAAVNRATHFRQLNSARTLTVNALVRVYFHVLTNDDGSNAAITTDQLKTEFTDLLASYAADNVCFLNAGTDYINNTYLNTLFNADNDPEGTLLSAYQVPRCINVFYMQAIKGNNTACNPPCGYGGIALGGIPGTFFLVAKGNIGAGSTISHEMGHNLGLLHTFETAFGYEKIDGSNAATTGDLVTDTPADPYAYNGSDCFKLSADKCRFIGVCPDSNNAINYKPPYTNLMAYWWNNNCYPNLAATNGQFASVNSYLATYTPLINCGSPLNVSAFGVSVSSGYYMNSAINTFTTIGSFLLNGSAKATIGGGTVLLKPGFHANPSSGGQVKITAKPCI